MIGLLCYDRRKLGEYVGKAFKIELAALPHTYKWALQFSSSKLTNLMGSPGLPLYIVGSGGSLSVAHLVADLYQPIAVATAKKRNGRGKPNIA